jgi:hypothetical protein
MSVFEIGAVLLLNLRPLCPCFITQTVFQMCKVLVEMPFNLCVCAFSRDLFGGYLDPVPLCNWRGTRELHCSIFTPATELASCPCNCSLWEKYLVWIGARDQCCSIFRHPVQGSMIDILLRCQQSCYTVCRPASFTYTTLEAIRCPRNEV